MQVLNKTAPASHSSNNLFATLQSSYHKFHSTVETALMKVKNDILLNMNKKHVTLLVLLDLSAAFDTLDHGILLGRLKSAFGAQDTALSWFDTCLTSRTQQVSIDGTLSRKFILELEYLRVRVLGRCCSLFMLAGYFKLWENIR